MFTYKMQKTKKKVVSSFEENNKHRHKSQQHGGINTISGCAGGVQRKFLPRELGKTLQKR